ncbi:hypothetical protein [Mesorhizobium sp. M0029]|uniref:hypothetical protein n=1 Tax=Mesorhizobium sp. M0029 TaxID=2956850 RepID=UPI00333CF1BD
MANFYREWAGSHELDVGRDGYCGPTIVAELVGAVQTPYLASRNPGRWLRKQASSAWNWNASASG